MNENKRGANHPVLRLQPARAAACMLFPDAVQHVALAECCTADPGSFQARVSGTIPGLQRTATQELRAALRPGKGQAQRPRKRPMAVPDLQVPRYAAAVSGSQWSRNAASQARPAKSCTARSAKWASRGLAPGSVMRSWPRVVQRQMMAWVTSG